MTPALVALSGALLALVISSLVVLPGACSPLRPDSGNLTALMAPDAVLLAAGGPMSGCLMYYPDENFQLSGPDSAAATAVAPAPAAAGTPLSAPLGKYILSGQGSAQQQQQQQLQQQPLGPASGPPHAPLSMQRLVQAAPGGNGGGGGGGVPNGGANIGLECQFITAEQLHDKFNRIRASGLRVSALTVRDSTLTTLGNLPQGFHELRKLSISNTSIDLEVLKEGSESLGQLTTLEIANEKISNIPQNFFQEMQSLRELRLENDEIASLDGDAFHNLDDSLEVLVLRNNRFNRFPMAVKNLAQLAVLDLSDNEIVIDTQENDLPEKLEPLLNLRELVMNRINCTCEFSSSPFFEWIARTHIAGVRCFAPDKLKSKEVIVFERDEFCVRPSSATSSASSSAAAASASAAPALASPWALAAGHRQLALLAVACQLLLLLLLLPTLGRAPGANWPE